MKIYSIIIEYYYFLYYNLIYSYNILYVYVLYFIHFILLLYIFTYQFNTLTLSFVIPYFFFILLLLLLLLLLFSELLYKLYSPIRTCLCLMIIYMLKCFKSKQNNVSPSFIHLSFCQHLSAGRVYNAQHFTHSHLTLRKVYSRLFSSAPEMPMLCRV